jgi:hypothetical protein
VGTTIPPFGQYGGGQCVPTGTLPVGAPCDIFSLRDAGSALCGPGEACDLSGSPTTCVQLCNPSAMSSTCPTGTTCINEGDPTFGYCL